MHTRQTRRSTRIHSDARRSTQKRDLKTRKILPYDLEDSYDAKEPKELSKRQDFAEPKDPIEFEEPAAPEDARTHHTRAMMHRYADMPTQDNTKHNTFRVQIPRPGAHHYIKQTDSSPSEPTTIFFTTCFHTFRTRNKYSTQSCRQTGSETTNTRFVSKNQLFGNNPFSSVKATTFMSILVQTTNFAYPR